MVFTFGSVTCAAAPDAGWLIAARLVQGAGSGLVAPQVLSLIRTGVSPQRRPRALALYGATMGVASLAGPLIGGLLVGADLFGTDWRAVFLVTVPVAALSLAGAARHARYARAARGLGRGSCGHHWLRRTGPAVRTGPGGRPALVDVGLLCHGRRRPDLLHPHPQTPPGPLVHPSVLRDRAARRGMLLVFVFNAGVPSFTYLLFLHLQSALGYPAISAALVSAPFAAAAVLGSHAAPALSHRLGPTVLTAAALVLAGTALALAPLISTEPGRRAAPPVLAAGGAAFGLFTAAVFTLVLAGVRDTAADSVSGLPPTAQQLGGSIGVTAAELAYYPAPYWARTGGPPTDSANAAFSHAMAYEAAVFMLTAMIALPLRRTTGPTRNLPPPNGSRSPRA
ncbi:MFS transporter [Streptomyces antimycoticus]